MKITAIERLPIKVTPRLSLLGKRRIVNAVLKAYGADGYQAAPGPLRRSILVRLGLA